MDSDSDSYYEENSENDEEGAGPLHVNLNVNLKESPESPPRRSPSPVLSLPPIPEEGLSPSWELRDDRDNFKNCYTLEDLLELIGPKRPGIE